MATLTPRTRVALHVTYGFIAALLIVLLITVLTTLSRPAQAEGAFTVTSADMPDGSTITEAQVYNGFGCTGKNISPGLSWTGAPEGTKSFAVTMYDPDAPTGSGWWHWIVYDIPGLSDGLPTGVGSGATPLPKHVHQASNDYGAASYGGPCPPAGAKAHRYTITVYALPTEKLDVPENASAALIGFNLKANALGSASLTATFGR
jgi:Raf kinase inhibitor-like YbhB/YbcL family protein